jgi:mRNA interferase MazF
VTESNRETNIYIPERGDIVYLDFDPTKGHEQRGRRPAFTVSPATYNSKTSLALFMPITSQQKGYPFEVILSKTMKISGVILTDQIKCLDWQVRNAQFVEKISQDLIEEVQAKIEPLIF